MIHSAVDQEILDKLDRILTLLEPRQKQSKPNKPSSVWKTLVKMTLDDFEVKDEGILYNEKAEEAIKFLKELAQVKFTPTICEAIVESYPALTVEGDPYSWATSEGYGNAAYETLTDELNALYNEHIKP